jgi:hypothetical protein
MSPQAVILNIAIIVAIVGIIVYWVRRFAVFRGYKSIEADVQKICELLKTEAVREGSDVVVAGHYSWFPTIVRFSHKVDVPGLDIQMRVPSNFTLSVTPKSASFTGEGRVLMRTGSTSLDKRFNARSDTPLEIRLLTGTTQALASLEQICCSTQTGFTIKIGAMELSELTIPPFTANHVFDHLQSMLVVARRVAEMPGASEIRVVPLPRRGSSWSIRVALSLALVCLVALLFAQPYGRSSGTSVVVANTSGVPAVDASRVPRLKGWHVMTPDDFSGAASRFLADHHLPATGHIYADFAGRGTLADSAYLLVNGEGQSRVSMLSAGMVAYDAVFPRIDLLARIPKASLGRIQWNSAPQFPSDGDALLVVQDVDDPAASLVLLRHGLQTYSGRPADFTQIILVSE